MQNTCLIWTGVLHNLSAQITAFNGSEILKKKIQLNCLVSSDLSVLSGALAINYFYDSYLHCGTNSPRK